MTKMCSAFEAIAKWSDILGVGSQFQRNDNRCPIELIPRVCWSRIFTFLDVKSSVSALCVSREFNIVCLSIILRS